MLPNLSVLWVIFFILVMTVIVDRLLLRPVLGVIRKREEAIESARELARRSATEAQAAAAEFDRKTAAARAEMYREMDEMRRVALGHRAEIVASTRAEAEAQVAEAARRLDAEASDARRRLQADAQGPGKAPPGGGGSRGPRTGPGGEDPGTQAPLPPAPRGSGRTTNREDTKSQGGGAA